MKQHSIIFGFLLVSAFSWSQTDSLFQRNAFMRMVDSLFIDHDVKNYSLRVFTNYKVKQFRIVNDTHKSRYFPNNTSGIGVGIANSKFLIDIAFNLKSGKKQSTHRFDAQGTFIIKKHHYFNWFIQAYNGFNIRTNFDSPDVFRTDIKSRTIGFNYLYTFSDIEFSYALIKAGITNQSKNVFVTGGLGTFAVADIFMADGSILPENAEIYFNEQAEIEKYNGKALGLLGGILTTVILSDNLIAICNVMPGVAIMNKEVTLADDRFRPSSPLLYKLDISFAVNYSIKRYYVNLIYGTGIYSTSLDYNNQYLFNLSMAKLAIGYKLKI